MNAAIGQPLAPTLTWNASSTGATYEYCYGTSNPCTNWASSGGGGTNLTVTLSTLSPLTTYYWQVRATNNFGITYADSGAVWSFTTSFGKTSPADNATLATQTTADLAWQTGPSGSTYEYCVAVATGPGSGTCTSTTGTWVSTGTATSVTVSGLTKNKTYLWQVRATYSGNTIYADGESTTWQFKTHN